MTALAKRKAAKPLVGSPLPRLAPPTPLRHDLDGYRETASTMGIDPMPWQENAVKYITAISPDDLSAYREVAIVVGRQNGKTTLTKPLILRRLKAGRHIMHIAQVRELPRIMFETIADALEESDPGLFPKRRGKIIWSRRGAGSESIVLNNGGSYRIAAAITGSARGFSIDDLIIDELREMNSFEVINSAKPTQRFSADPQTIYLSNAGTDDSTVLNSLRKRSQQGDPSLAYLEWSADPDYAADDRRGWVQANPSIGHYAQVLRDLEKDYVAASLGGNMAGFETEALCRWQVSMDSRLVADELWKGQEFGDFGQPTSAVMAVNMDITGERASAVIAWKDDDDRIALDVHDTKGAPIDVSLLGPDLVKLARSNRVMQTAFDPYTDTDLVRYIPRGTRAVNGREYASATEKFVRLVNERKLRVHDPSGILAEDLRWTTKRKAAFSSYMAVKANDEHTNTAALAAIRAAWLASAPVPVGPARIF